MSAPHLKDKTDAECRELAGHYYNRSRKAEKELKAALQLVSDLERENQRMHDLACRIIEP